MSGASLPVYVGTMAMQEHWLHTINSHKRQLTFVFQIQFLYRNKFCTNTSLGWAHRSQHKVARTVTAEATFIIGDWVPLQLKLISLSFYLPLPNPPQPQSWSTFDWSKGKGTWVEQISWKRSPSLGRRPPGVCRGREGQLKPTFTSQAGAYFHLLSHTSEKLKSYTLEWWHATRHLYDLHFRKK